ncbi:MAG: hypothetical protein WBA76_03525 [Phormidesmis sp.]
MKGFFFNRLISSFQKGLGLCIAALQHLLMKAAVAVSLKLCLFTARVLMGAKSSSRQPAGQSF